MPKALGEKKELSCFKRAHLANIGLSGFKTVYPVDNFEVEVETLDYFFALPEILSPTVLKIDVEGWEEKVILGSQKLLKNVPPRVVGFETNCEDNGSLGNNNLTKILENYGYQINMIPKQEAGEKVRTLLHICAEDEG